MVVLGNAAFVPAAELNDGALDAHFDQRFGDTGAFQQVERGRVKGRRAVILLYALFLFEHGDRYAFRGE